jgi:UrcA family protein
MIAIATTAGFAATAQADGDDGARYDDVVVNFSDLNLGTAAGNQKLYARLENAASRACGSAPSTYEVKRTVQYRACVESTLNRAIDKLSASDQHALREAVRKDSVG